MSVRRPTSVKIGWTTWKIKWMSEKEWKEAEGADDGDGGLTWSATHEIWVRLIFDDPYEPAIRPVLMHEILHAICTVTDVGNAVTYVKSRNVEEVMVGALAAPLLAVLNDNPKVREYLLAR